MVLLAKYILNAFFLSNEMAEPWEQGSLDKH
jgi:hypothetical protein